MKLRTRRELLRMIWPEPKVDYSIRVDGSRCTGCGLCTIDCPTEALTICHSGKGDTYQLEFRHTVCMACGACEKSCPEHCLHLETILAMDRVAEAPAAIFQDRVSRCPRCGIPLFPQAMIDRLRARLSSTGESPWQFDSCPSCRMKALLERESLTRREVNVQGNKSWEPSSGQ